MGRDVAMIELFRPLTDFRSGIFVQILVVGALVSLELFAVLDDPIEAINVGPPNANRSGNLDPSVELVVAGIVAQFILMKIVEIFVLLVGHIKHIKICASHLHSLLNQVQKFWWVGRLRGRLPVGILLHAIEQSLGANCFYHSEGFPFLVLSFSLLREGNLHLFECAIDCSGVHFGRWGLLASSFA